MAAGKSSSERFRDQAEKQKKKEMGKAIAKVEAMVQKTAKDIPVFPYGYKDEHTNPNGRERPQWATNANLTNDWLSSMPTIEELENLYGQIDQYTSSVSPLMLSSLRERVVAEKLSYSGTAVTPVCFDGMKHLYHIIRIRDVNKRFLEFLRQLASGYILAFRLFDSLDQFLTAYWCYFCDEPRVAEDLKGMFKFKRTQYQARYSVPQKVMFGMDTMSLGFPLLSVVFEQFRNAAAGDQVAADGDDDDDVDDDDVDDDDLDDDTVYRDNRRDPETVVFFHFCFFVLGECPRSDLFKNKMNLTITTRNQVDCEPVGLVFEGLARHWNFSCKTALLLRLMIKDIEIGRILKVARPDIYLELKKEIQSYSKMAQERCLDIVWDDRDIQVEYKLTKELVHKVVRGEVVGCYMYKKEAYDRIVNYCLSLIMYSELALGVKVRDEKFQKPLYLKEFAVKECSEKAIDGEALFFALFKSFLTEHEEAASERRSAIWLGFLDAAVLFLKRWGYSTLVKSALDLDDVNKWCKMFKVSKQSMDEVKAGNSVMSAWRKDIKKRNSEVKDVTKRVDLTAALKELVKFINENIPMDGSDLE